MTDNELGEIWREPVPEDGERDHSWAPRTWRRRRRMLHLKLFGELAGGGGAIVVAAWFLRQNASFETALLLAIVVLVLLSWGANVRLWWEMSRIVHEHTADYIARLLAEAELELRAQTWMSRIVWISVALVFPWALYVLWSHSDVYLIGPWRGIVGFGGISLIFTGILWQLHHKRESLEDEVRRLRAWKEDFQEVSTT